MVLLASNFKSFFHLPRTDMEGQPANSQLADRIAGFVQYFTVRYSTVYQYLSSGGKPSTHRKTNEPERVNIFLSAGCLFIVQQSRVLDAAV